MGATTTAQISWLVNKFKQDYPELLFQPAEDFLWRYQTKTIFYSPTGNPAYLIHELCHFLLGHQNYSLDIDLVKMERDAWQKARSLGQDLLINIDEDLIQDALDTYRAWLHNRSICPQCQSTGLQSSKNEYSCINCPTTWRVNQAKSCQLRRYIKKSAP